jgi:phospholipase C
MELLLLLLGCLQYCRRPPCICNMKLFFLLCLLVCSQFVITGTQAQTISGPIKTVVVLVMENRSFDHMLGFLKLLNPEVDGLTGDETNPLPTATAPSNLITISDNAEFVDPDPGHSFEAITEQVFGPGGTPVDPAPMDGFAIQAETVVAGLSTRVMSAFRPEVIPVHTALAMNFAVFDRWYSSVPTSTQPNRLFVHSATSHGLMSNLQTVLAMGLPQQTIMDDIADAGLSFGVYYQNVPTTLFFSNMRKLKYVNNFMDYDAHFHLDAAMGNLPSYVVVEQRYYDLESGPANDDHPSHDIAQGQALIKDVYETLRASPQWNELLLLITYDEHGGFYDHVPTPQTGIPNPDGILGPAPENFNFDRLGVRVPTIAVSPWINQGTVVHEAVGPTATSHFEHSSIPATVRKLFNLPSPPLTAREAWAGTFEDILSQRTTPRTDAPATLPSPPWSLRQAPVNEHALLTEFQSDLVNLASALNGARGHKTTTTSASDSQLTVGEANFFVETAVSRFLQAGRAQLKTGADPESLVKADSLSPVVSTRT